MFSKFSGTPLCTRMVLFSSLNSRSGTAVLSPKHQYMPPLNSCSVHDLRFCNIRMQKVDLPDPVGPLIMEVKGFLNYRSSSITKNNLCYLPIFIPPHYLPRALARARHYSNIAKLHRRNIEQQTPLKNDTVLYSGSVIIDTIPSFKFLFRLILCSVCTVTVWKGSWFNIMSLITSKFSNCEAL